MTTYTWGDTVIKVAVIQNRTHTSIIFLSFSPPQRNVKFYWPLQFNWPGFHAYAYVWPTVSYQQCVPYQQTIQTSQIIWILKEKWAWAWHNYLLPRVTCTETRPETITGQGWRSSWPHGQYWFLAKGKQASRLSSRTHQRVQIPSSNLQGCSRRMETCCDSFQILIKELQLYTKVWWWGT